MQLESDAVSYSWIRSFVSDKATHLQKQHHLRSPPDSRLSIALIALIQTHLTVTVHQVQPTCRNTSVCGKTEAETLCLATLVLVQSFITCITSYNRVINLTDCGVSWGQLYLKRFPCWVLRQKYRDTWILKLHLVLRYMYVFIVEQDSWNHFNHRPYFI